MMALAYIRELVKIMDTRVILMGLPCSHDAVNCWLVLTLAYGREPVEMVDTLIIMMGLSCSHDAVNC